MANPDDQLKQLVSRLDKIEQILQSQIQRIHAVETQLGLPPASITPPSLVTPAEPPALQIVSPSTPRTDQRFVDSAQVEAANAQFPSPNTREESLESKIGGNVLNKVGMAA